MKLDIINPHWSNDFFYGFEIRRALLKNIESDLGKKYIQIIYGMRRTGKTVMLRQIIDGLIRKGTPRTAVLYYTFDEKIGEVGEVLEEYKKEFGKYPSYVLLDEVQKAKRWAEDTKIYYDTYGLKFVLTGSATVRIRKSARESLAGRTFAYVLRPLSFQEYLVFSKKQEMAGRKGAAAAEEFRQYSLRQFPECVGLNRDDLKRYVSSLVEKIIYEDIPQTYKIEDLKLLNFLFSYVAQNPGVSISYNELSHELGVNRETISNYLHYLEGSFLVRRLTNYSRRLVNEEKAAKKFYLGSTALSLYADNTLPDGLFENMAVLATDAEHFWSSGGKEVDIVLDKAAFEVKNTKSIMAKHVRHLVRFGEKYRLPVAVIYNGDYESTFDAVPLIPIYEVKRIREVAGLADYALKAEKKGSDAV